MENALIRVPMHMWSTFYDWGGLNIEIFRLINDATLPWMDVPIVTISALGSYWGAPAMFLLLLLLSWRWGINRQHEISTLALLQSRRFVIAFIICWLMVAFFKLTLNFQRPLAAIGGTVNIAGDPEYAYGFPSGHAAYTALAIAILWPLMAKRLRYALLAFALLLGWARIAGGAHFPADVLWGAAVGLVSALIASRVTATPGPATWIGLSAAILGLDQFTKSAVIKGISYQSVVPVTSFFDLIHTRNTGAAFSLFAQGSGWQVWFLTIVAFVVSAWLVWRLLQPAPRLEAAGYCLVLGGAMANAVDRAMNGYVTDFLSFYWQGWYWPAFNLADVAISSGAILLILSMVLFDRARVARKET